MPARCTSLCFWRGPDVPEPIKQDIFLGDFPEMTEKGTFIINGTERVVVSPADPLAGCVFRSPGGSLDGPSTGHGQADPGPRRLDGIRDPQERLPDPEVQSQAHRAGDDFPARPGRGERWLARLAHPRQAPMKSC